MDLGSGGGGRGGVARGQVAVRQNIATFFLPPSLPSFLRYRFTFPANRAGKEKEGRGGEERNLAREITWLLANLASSGGEEREFRNLVFDSLIKIKRFILLSLERRGFLYFNICFIKKLYHF